LGLLDERLINDLRGEALESSFLRAAEKLAAQLTYIQIGWRKASQAYNTSSDRRSRSFMRVARSATCQPSDRSRSPIRRPRNPVRFSSTAPSTTSASTSTMMPQDAVKELGVRWKSIQNAIAAIIQVLS